MAEFQGATTAFLMPPPSLEVPQAGSSTNLPVLEDEKLEKIENILIRNETDDALHTVVSALYGKLLVVMGVVFPIIDALISGTFTRFNGFYLCMNLGSIIFMAYIYGMHLKEENRNRLGLTDPNSQKYRQARYGSNYLRAGVACFGIGSMIFSGLEFGRYFEINPSADCHSWLIAISPLCRIIFVLVQMLFVFSNSKVQHLVDHGASLHKSIIRYGLMHMIATNLCEWLYVLVEETKQDILRSQQIRLDRGLIDPIDAENGSDFQEPCWNSKFMNNLIQNSSAYLFPCTVEYSLLCAVILGVMWHNLSHKSHLVMHRESNRLQAAKSRFEHSTALMVLNDHQSGVNVIYTNNVSRFSVDCANSYKGLFSGILILVLTIISLIMFFELVHVNLELAVLQVNIWETVLFGTAITATIACAVILRNVGYRRHRRRLELEHILLLVTQIGVFLYFLFQIFGGYYYLQHGNNQDYSRSLRLVTPIACLIQSSCQTVLVLDAWRRQCINERQFRKKSGRELVTFLLICNLALWIVNRLKNNSAEFHPMQMEFYGTWGWTVITHVTMPLVVCYRFQSTVCLYEIWKHVYKNPQRHAHFYSNL